MWDAEADASRRWVAERFLNRTWPRLKMLKAEIEMDDPVIAERLAVFQREAQIDAKAAAQA